MTRGLTAVLLLVLSASTGAIGPEEIFQEAESYTVRIRTRIEIGIGDDESGVFNGAGFVVDRDLGWILTNRHVVGESPSHVRISQKGKDYIEASKVYVDPYSDFAVIQAEVSQATEANLECKKMPGTGHPVGAYGHPWGLHYTGTQGIISGRTDNYRVDLLQTDAPINAGNSGGPLISMRSGRVIGISTATYADDDAENTNFAVPITEVCEVLALLRDEKDPSPPWLPVVFYNLENQDRLIVARSYISEGQLDLRPHDRILTAGPGRRPVKKHHELINVLRGSSNNIVLGIERDGQILEISGWLWPHRLRRGIEFAGVVFTEGRFLDAPATGLSHDIIVDHLRSGSAGQAVGIKRWDFVTSVNNTRVVNLEHLYELLETGSTDRKTMVLEFMRVWEENTLFEHIRRELPAEKPVWLKSNGKSTLVEFARSRAEWGDTRAQLWMAALYSEGYGGAPKDVEEALRWLRQAAEQGSPEGQWQLGFAYVDGEGVVQDTEEAAKWYRRAAEQNDPMGQVSLGYMYLEGNGVPKNRIEAYKWLELAARSFGDDVAPELAALQSTMTPSEILKAQQLVEAWLQDHEAQGEVQ